MLLFDNTYDLQGQRKWPRGQLMKEMQSVSGVVENVRHGADK